MASCSVCHGPRMGVEALLRRYHAAFLEMQAEHVQIRNLSQLAGAQLADASWKPSVLTAGYCPGRVVCFQVSTRSSLGQWIVSG